MSNNRFQPKKVHELSDAGQIKAYIHPTRIVLLEMLAREQRSISSIAREMSVHPANITHHFRLLEKNGLIRLVEKRETGKNLEKFYRAIAFSFMVKSEDKGIKQKKALALSILMNDLSVAVKSVRDDNAEKVIALLTNARIDAGVFDRFAGELETLVRKFQAAETETGNSYTLNLSLYPNDVDLGIQKKNSAEIKI